MTGKKGSLSSEPARAGQELLWNQSLSAGGGRHIPNQFLPGLEEKESGVFFCSVQREENGVGEEQEKATKRLGF